MDHKKLALQRYELANTPELWQFNLLIPQKLCQFAKERSIPIFRADTVIDLWRVGLLRSDLVMAQSQLKMPSLEFVSEENGQFLYCDKRPVEYCDQGYGGIIARTENKLDGVELLFHPFRLYVLYHIDRVFRSNIDSTQYLLSPDGLINLTRYEINSLNKWTSGDKFAELFEHWNRIAELAIVLEPTAYETVFHTVRWGWPDTQHSLEAKLKKRRESVRKFLSETTAKEINEIRAELCQNAELLDKNKLVHVLLRLMSQHERLKLRSALGGCMQFLSMAEIIRRAAEEALGQELPEEDELGFGQWVAGARKSIYGSDRILDASPATRRDFLTSMGLDYGVKVRCYVEGDTEVGALTSAVGEAGGTQFINLCGRVVEKKGLSFKDSLKNDQKSHVFSVVMLDGDRKDNIRVVKKAAEDKTLFGRFFVLSPDFEFANFTISELVDALLDWLNQDGEVEKLPAREEIMAFVEGAASGKEFFEALEEKSGLQDIGKGEAWGVALMKYALQHPYLPQDHKEAGKTRPVIEVAQLLVNARYAGYLRSQEEYEVDPATGELQKK